MRFTVIDAGSELDREMAALEARREEEQEVAILQAVARSLREQIANLETVRSRNPWPRRGFNFHLNAPYPIDSGRSDT